MGPGKSDEGIESLKQKLFSRTQTLEERPRRALHEDAYTVKEEWEHETEPQPNIVPMARPRYKKAPATNKLIRFVFAGSLAFFLLSIGVAVVMFFTGGNTVSADNIEIAVAGPLAVAGGSELLLQIEITNRNSVPIRLADLIIEYPDGTRTANDLSIDMSRLRETIGTIEPGGKAKTTAKAVLFGDEDSTKSILITVEYRVDGSNAIFYKERPYGIVLSSAPLALVVESLGEISAGQPVVMKLKLASNATNILKDIIVKAEYPFGFELQSATPKATFDNSLWRIGDLQPGATREIELRGILVGETNDERVFRFAAGTTHADSPREIAAVFDSAEVPVSIRAPFVGLVVAVNGETSAKPTVARRGEAVQVDIEWTNNLETPIYDLEIEAKISGNALNPDSISTDGFYRSIDSMVLWNKETTTGLQEVGAGKSGVVKLELGSIPLTSDVALPRPTMTVDVSVRAKRLLENNVPENLTSTGKKTILVGSTVDLLAQTQYSTGKFNNSGPIPPRINLETTYTIRLAVTNSTNDVKDGLVIARLPWYVTWTGKTDTDHGTIKYNPVGGEIVWDIGVIPARTGYQKEIIEGSFQVSLTPSTSQVEQSPVLVINPTFTGVDTFTQSVVETGRREQTTVLSGESQFGDGSGRVAE